MPLPLIKQILRKSFWGYPAYVPRPAWKSLFLDIREVEFRSLMRRTVQKPALPLPRFWQGLQFDIMDYEIGNGPGTCTAYRTGNTYSINFEDCHPFITDHLTENETTNSQENHAE